MGSFSLSLCKGVTETMTHSGFLGDFYFYSFTGAALLCAAGQLKLLNKVMELFEQVDVIPVYQSSLILLNIAAGSIILEERKLYSGQEMLNILLCGLISISGVWIIIKKPQSRIKCSSKVKTIIYKNNIELADTTGSSPKKECADTCPKTGKSFCSCVEVLFDVEI